MIIIHIDTLSSSVDYLGVGLQLLVMCGGGEWNVATHTFGVIR